MLIAELRSKLLGLDGLSLESKEDILTGDVFGVLKYLPRVPYLQAVARAAARKNPWALEYAQHLDTLVASCQSIQFAFWPSYPTPAGISAGRTEPDVELSNAQFYILVEAKLRSGFGERQVERELGVALTQGREREAFVLLVTPSSLPPRFAREGARLRFDQFLSEAIKSHELPPAAASLLQPHGRRVLWMSWASILVALKEAYAEHHGLAGDTDIVARCGEMISDLELLLEQRGIRPFRGLHKTAHLHPRVATTRPLLWSVSTPTTSADSPLKLINVIGSFAPQAFGWACPRPRRNPKATPFSIPACCSAMTLAELSPCFKIVNGRRGGDRNEI